MKIRRPTNSFLASAAAVVVATAMGCGDGSSDAGALDENVLVFTEQDFSPGVVQQIIDDDDTDARLSGSVLGKAVTIVKLSGKTNHFGRDENLEYLDYHATVPDTKVWIAEHPWTRDLDVRTDETGWWTLYVVKDAGVDLDFSFVYEKEGWVTTKTNVITIADVDDTDLAIQYIDPFFFETAMRPFVEGMMRTNGYPDFLFENAMVVTVGKSWGSIHDDRLPHGDPGAVMTLSPDSEDFIGPIYFDEDVVPNVEWTSTSVDGGVTWLNMPLNETYRVSAKKEGVRYPTVSFRLDEADRAAGVQLYIASPPDSLEGDNDSPPGEY